MTNEDKGYEQINSIRITTTELDKVGKILDASIAAGANSVQDVQFKLKDATEAQANVKARRDILDKYPPFPPTLKALLHRMYGFPRWSVKPPLVSIAPEVEEQVVHDFEDIG